MASLKATVTKQRAALEEQLVDILSIQMYLTSLWEYTEVMKEKSEQLLKELDAGELE